MSQDEITVMDGGKCIYQLREVIPFLSDKFDITKHKNYKLLEDYDKKNLFDVEEYLTNRDKVKLNSKSKILKINLWYKNILWLIDGWLIVDKVLIYNHTEVLLYDQKRIRSGN